MIKYTQMILTAVLLLIEAVVSAAFAGESEVVSTLPEPIRAFAEVETNVVFDARTAGDNLWRLTIDLDASISNSVEFVVGCDSNASGTLELDEGEFILGWRAGNWYWRDRRGENAQSAIGNVGMANIGWTLRLNRNKSAMSVKGNVFSGAVPSTAFNPAWNMFRVVARGAETINVHCKTTVDGMIVKVR